MEPSDKSGRPSRLARITAIGWAVLGLFWGGKAVYNATAASYGTDFYFGLVLGLGCFALSAAQWILCSKAKRSTPRVENKEQA